VVAFSSTRRRLHANSPNELISVDLSKLDLRVADPPDGAFCAGSRRARLGVETVRDRLGQIVQVRIGRWRVLAAAAQRRITEVRELTERRVAVRIERFADGYGRPSSEIWHLYDAEGRLEAALQSSTCGKFALATNYQTRQACRLVRDARGELKQVETWRI
jgi:hypothetical protein